MGLLKFTERRAPCQLHLNCKNRLRKRDKKNTKSTRNQKEFNINNDIQSLSQLFIFFDILIDPMQ